MGIQADQHKLLWSERKEMSGHVHIYFPSITFSQNTHTDKMIICNQSFQRVGKLETMREILQK